MDSPIIILVFWVIINILLKSSRDKKKAEQARRKSGQANAPDRQRQKPERSRMNTGMKDFRQALEDYKAQIEKELNPEKKTPAKPPAKVPATEARQRVDRSDSRLEKPKMKTFREGRYWEDITDAPEKDRWMVPISLYHLSDISVRDLLPLGVSYVLPAW